MEFEKLYPGKVVDWIVTSATVRTTDRFGLIVNRILSNTDWRLGHSNGRRALLRVVPPHRQIVLWPRGKRA